MRLDKSKFVAWLKAKPPADIVGENCDSHSCPIALFYEEVGGCEVVIFQTGGDYMIDRGYSKKVLPPWAQKFVLEIDGDEDNEISAARALEVLAG